MTCVNVCFLMYKVCSLTQTKVFLRKHRFRTHVNVCFSMYVLCSQAQTLVCLRKHRFRIGVNVCFTIVYLPQMNAYICLTFISTGCDKDIVVFRKILHFAKLLLCPPFKRCACVGSRDNSMAETHTHCRLVDVNVLLACGYVLIFTPTYVFGRIHLFCSDVYV